MKKTFYVFAALLAGFAMVACDKDDNGGDGGGGDAVTFFGMPSSVTFEREGQEDSGLAYTMTGDKISKITYSYAVSADKQASVDYTVVYEPNKCTVSYESAALGENMKFVYDLNAAGFATRGARTYVSDGYEEYVSTYTYNSDKMLAKIEMDDEETFAATYAGTELKSITSLDFGVMQVTNSATLNGSKVDPLYFLLFGIFTQPDPSVEQMAVACGLLPQSKFVPKSLTAKDEESGQEMSLPLMSTVSGGKLTQVAFDDLTLIYRYK